MEKFPKIHWPNINSQELLSCAVIKIISKPKQIQAELLRAHLYYSRMNLDSPAKLETHPDTSG